MFHRPALTGRPLRALTLVVGLGIAAIVRAAPAPPAAPDARLDLQLGASRRTDSLHSGPVDLRARGAALSDLAARAAWWRPGTHLGLAARIEGARFTLRAGEQPSASPATLTGFDAGAALIWRAQPTAALALEGSAGYGLHRIPLATVRAGPAGEPLLASGHMSGHGPDLSLAAALWLAPRFTLELEVEGTPFMFGAARQGITLRPRRLSTRGQVTVPLGAAGPARWAALLAYQLVRLDAGQAGLDIQQTRHQLAIGLRASWGPPPLAPAPPPATPVKAPPAVPPSSAITGLVRGPDGQPALANVTIVERGLSISTDAAGAFRLQLPPGRYTLSISADGFVTQTKRLDTRAGEERIYNVDLTRLQP